MLEFLLNLSIRDFCSNNRTHLSYLKARGLSTLKIYRGYFFAEFTEKTFRIYVSLWYNLAAVSNIEERSRSLAYRARLECV